MTDNDERDVSEPGDLWIVSITLTNTTSALVTRGRVGHLSPSGTLAGGCISGPVYCYAREAMRAVDKEAKKSR